MSNRKRRKPKDTGKSPVNWIEVLVQFLTGLLTGIILLIIEKFFL